MENIEELSRKLCDQIGVLYWHDALMGAHMRGSRVRVRPHKDMILERRYLKQVVVMGATQTLLFDALYLDHYEKVTGIDFRLQWAATSEKGATIAIKNDSNGIALETLTKFLKSGNISLTGSNPRHSLLIKFKTYLETQ